MDEERKFCTECGSRLKITEEYCFRDKIAVWGTCPKYNTLRFWPPQRHDMVFIKYKTIDFKYDPYTGERINGGSI